MYSLNFLILFFDIALARVFRGGVLKMLLVQGMAAPKSGIRWEKCSWSLQAKTRNADPSL